VLGTNPNQIKSGSGFFGLKIRSTKGFPSSSPDPDLGAEASFPKLTTICGKFSWFFYVCVTLLFSASYNMTETHIIRIDHFLFPICTNKPFICELANFLPSKNPYWSKTNPKLPGSGSGFARIRLKAGFGFGSGKIPKFRDLPSTNSYKLDFIIVSRTNTNPTKSGFGSFGLGIRATDLNP
jgi:hypothetical protein